MVLVGRVASFSAGCIIGYFCFLLVLQGSACFFLLIFILVCWMLMLLVVPYFLFNINNIFI